MTEAIITWTSMMSSRSKLTRTENAVPINWGMKINQRNENDSKWYENITMTKCDISKKCKRWRGFIPCGQKFVAITVVIFLFFSSTYFPPLKYFPCSKNHWYIKVQNFTKKRKLGGSKNCKTILWTASQLVVKILYYW